MAVEFRRLNPAGHRADTSQVNAAVSPARGPALSDRDFNRVAELIKRHAGINLSSDKRDLVRSRLTKRLRAVGADDFSIYLDTYILPKSGTAHAAEFTAFVDALSTNLTSFFREPAHYEYLRDKVLPGLIAKGRGRIRAWCAAASTGEEPYCLAMTCLESMRKAGISRPDVKILSTDICTKVLGEAKAGVYSNKRSAQLPTDLRGRYFEPRRMTDGSEAIAAGRMIKDACVFRQLNLMEPPPFSGPLDFIFCRNVMIYFDRPTRDALVGRLLKTLAPGGHLFTGHSESLANTCHVGPALRQVMAAVYQKTT